MRGWRTYYLYLINVFRCFPRINFNLPYTNENLF
ncbi:hypothetical protein SOVF_198360 [Spinacia oleracea]|nr:hypothetical protein SOVF_198360 [Spinacia oleracea]